MLLLPALVVALVVALAATSGGAASVQPTSASPGGDRAEPAQAGVVRVRLHAAPRRLEVRREVRSGYDRDLFVHWISQGEGCDTRDSVLIAEARRDPDVGVDCDLTGGRWFSYYDGVRVDDPSSLDIDHMVPLAEAWDSGARVWSDRRRQRFANDLGDRRSLVAVTASSNRAKSDQDPREWLPQQRVCRYVKEWLAVKLRWSLTVDRPERRALLSAAQGCPDRTLRVRMAR